jgi:hypothetical protein
MISISSMRQKAPEKQQKQQKPKKSEKALFLLKKILYNRVHKR